MSQDNARRRRWPMVTGVAAVTLAGAGLAGTQLASAATAGCRVRYTVTNQWQGGFGANVERHQSRRPGQRLAADVDVRAGQTVTQLWNGSVAQSGGAVTVTNVSYNGRDRHRRLGVVRVQRLLERVQPGAGLVRAQRHHLYRRRQRVPRRSHQSSVRRRRPRQTSAARTPPPGGTGRATSTPPAARPASPRTAPTRALYGAYNGNLYQVRRSSDNTTRNIGVLSRGRRRQRRGPGLVLRRHHLRHHGRLRPVRARQRPVVPGIQRASPGSPQSSPARATTESLTVGGSKAYSLYINPGNSYWRDGHLTGVPTGSAPEGMYMVTSGTHVNSGCCFDYGNSETTRKADARRGHGRDLLRHAAAGSAAAPAPGPWVQADLEWGLYPGGSQSWNPNQRAFTSKFVTATLKNNGTSRFAIKGSNAQSGSLYTLWDGALPSGYSPMKKQGAIILGSGGDCCKPDGGANLSAGTFYEGAMVAGYPSDATENAVQANIVAAGYR